MEKKNVSVSGSLLCFSEKIICAGIIDHAALNIIYSMSKVHVRICKRFSGGQKNELATQLSTAVIHL